MPMEVRAPPHYYYYYYYYYYYHHHHHHHHHHLIRTTPTTTNNNNVKIFNSTQTFKNVLVLKFELILIIGSNNVLTEGARKVYHGRRVGQGWPRYLLSNWGSSYRNFLGNVKKLEYFLHLLVYNK
jgi:Ca2+/Na+ antiporter